MHEYPLMLHKAQGPVDANGYDHSNVANVVVNDGDEEAAARAEGFGELHDAKPAKVSKKGAE